MSTQHKVRLHPGYTLRLADLMTPVDIAEDCTLGDLCRIIDNCDEIDITTVSALLQCRLEPFLDECLRPRDTSHQPSDLHYIRLSWECEYDLLSETRWPPSTSLWLHVDGIGDIWEDHQPGGRFYEEGKDFSQCNRYAIEMTPLYALRHLPLRIDPIMRVQPSITQASNRTSIEIPAPDVTLLRLIHALFWEFSFFGTPEQRDDTHADLQQRVKRIEAGKERLNPFEDIKKAFDGTEC